MEYVVEVVIITDQLQQGMPRCAIEADAEQVFCSRIQPVDEQTVVDDDDGGIELIRDTGRRATVTR
jgi:hypothetical protein